MCVIFVISCTSRVIARSLISSEVFSALFRDPVFVIPAYVASGFCHRAESCILGFGILVFFTSSRAVRELGLHA